MREGPIKSCCSRKIMAQEVLSAGRATFNSLSILLGGAMAVYPHGDWEEFDLHLAYNKLRQSVAIKSFCRHELRLRASDDSAPSRLALSGGFSYGSK